MLADRDWRLVPYITRLGRSPVQEFLDELRHEDPGAYEEFLAGKELLEEHGPGIGQPYWLPLGGGLHEIRWRARRIRFRVYCALPGGRRIVMWHAVRKKWRRFSADDRKKCNKRLSDLCSPAYDQEQRELLYLSKRRRWQRD